MRNIATVSRIQKAFQDLDLLKILQSEIKHELSSSPFQNEQSGLLGDFSIDYDSPKTQDVVLRKKCESGEEVAVSALLGELNPADLGKSTFLREVLMKVCIRKPGLSNLLLFDCGVSKYEGESLAFEIHKAYFLPSKTSLSPSVYRGPIFSTLDRSLQDAFKEYLTERGIDESLRNFLFHHLYKKEQGQYVDWLQKLESFVGDGQ